MPTQPNSEFFSYHRHFPPNPGSILSIPRRLTTPAPRALQTFARPPFTQNNPTRSHQRPSPSYPTLPPAFPLKAVYPLFRKKLSLVSVYSFLKSYPKINNLPWVGLSNSPWPHCLCGFPALRLCVTPPDPSALAPAPRYPTAPSHQQKNRSP